jgi:Holliday junction resolvase RusA-like endonuclease
MPTDYATWKATVATLAKDVPELPPADHLEAYCKVTMTHLALRPKTSKLAYPKPDVDNYAKSVMDALTESRVWWDDDDQVISLLTEKSWAKPGDPAGITVSVTYEPG